MSRLQVNDSFGGQQLQTHARPVAAHEQAAAPQDDGRWKALANVFAQGAGLAETLQVQQQADDTAAAKKWSQSMTVSELGKKIQSGEMLPSQSPVFVGTVQHIYGVNTHETGMRDMTSKLTTGELKFNSAAEADQYMTEWRNTSLAGQSKYATAGFDKAYAAGREKVLDQVTKINDATWVNNAQAQATDFLGNAFNKVSQSDFKGTHQEAAAELMSQYQLMRQTKTLPDAAAKGALGEMTARMAVSGRKDILAAFLETEMDGIGKVRGFLGDTKAATLENHAQAKFDGDQRKRIDDEILPFMTQASAGELRPSFREWALSAKNKDYVSASQIHSLEQANLAAVARQQNELLKSQLAGAIGASDVEATRRIDGALLNGNLASVMGTNRPMLMKNDGSLAPMSEKDVQERAEMVAKARTRGMDFGQTVGFYAQNGLKNSDWEALMNQGFHNLNTLAVSSVGKPVGTLNDTGKDAVEMFRHLDLAYPDYAKTMMSDKQYGRFSDIVFLRVNGQSLDGAAALAAMADSRAVVGSDTDKLVKKVHASVSKIGADPFYKADWAQRLWGDNTNLNTAQMTGTLRRYASLLAQSGQFPDADMAIEAAANYIADPKVSVKVNGTVYLRRDIPSGPPSRTPEAWLDLFITEGPKKLAAEKKAKPEQVRLEFDPLHKQYRAWVGGMMLTDDDAGAHPVVYDQAAIQQWYITREQIDVVEAAAKGTANVQGIKDTRSAGARASEWAKQVEAGTLPQTAPRTPEPEKPMRNIPDFWMTPEGQAAVSARKGVQGGPAQPR